MTSAALCRIVWKEFRLQRSFWIAVFCLALFLQFSTYLSAQLNGTYPGLVVALFGVGLGVPAIFALGSGAMLFAGEREAETYDFQRALPATAGTIIAGKLLWAIAGSLTMVLMAWFSAWLFAARQVPPSTQHWITWLASLSAIAEVLAWSILFSLLLQRVIWATVCGAVTAAITGLVAVPNTILSMRDIIPTTDIDYFTSTLPMRFIVPAAVLAIDLWLAHRWYRASRARVFPIRDPGDRFERDSAAMTAWPARSTMFAHLLWQAWRQQLTTLLTMLGALSVLAVWGYLFLVNPTPGPRGVSTLPIILIPVAATLVGSCLFLSDQRRETFQYFAERGVGPRLVWLSRQCVGALAICVWLLAVLALAGVDLFRWLWESSGTHPPVGASRIQEWMALTLGALGFSVLCYSVGQLASLLCRSGVIGLFFGIVGSLVACWWTVFMYELRVPLWLSVLPLPLVFFWASWYRAPDWIAGRTTRRARLRLVASLAIPLLLVAVSVIVFRVIEIPRHDPPLALPSLHEPPTAAAAETARLYQEAAELCDKEQAARPDEPAATSGPEVQGKEEAPSVPVSAAVVEKLREANQRDECWLPTDIDLARSAQTPSHYRFTDQIPNLTTGVLAYCDQQQSVGDTDAAWSGYQALLQLAKRLQERGDERQYLQALDIERRVSEQLPGWAATPGQTAERVRNTVKWLETELSGPVLPPPAYLTHNYEWGRAFLDFERWAWSTVPQRERRWEQTAITAMPWERWRLRRLLDACWSDCVTDAREFEKAFAAGTATFSRRPSERMAAWSETSWPLLKRVMPWPLKLAAEQRVMQETRRRAVRLQLALVAWELEHGALPDRLEQLAGGQIAQLPLDPYTGRLFLYWPAGVSTPARDGVLPWGQDTDARREIAPFTPLLWSAGPLLRLNSAALWAPEGRPEFRFEWIRESWRPTEDSLWPLGWGFPIPAYAGKKARLPE